MMDFTINALPWIAMGLFVACSCVMMKAKKVGKQMSKLFVAMTWLPAVCFLILAILEMYSGSQSRGTTWLVLGVANAVINFANTQKES